MNVNGTTPIRHVAVVGTGVIGASWAAYFLNRGLTVTATDPAPDAEPALRSFVANVWETLALLHPTAIDWQARLRFEPSLEATVCNADLVQENGPEREALKIELFARSDAAARPAASAASSASGLLISRLQSRCLHPERCVIAHPFNPPHLVPLVEIVGGEATSTATIERALAFYRAVGKHPIHVRKEVDGHIANRLQAALWREAFSLVENDIASVADVDAAITHGPGLRWALFGPIVLQHMSGGEAGLPHTWTHLLPSIVEWWKTFGTPSMSAELGAKTAEGVREEIGDQTVRVLEMRRDRMLVRLLQTLAGEGEGEVR